MIVGYWITDNFSAYGKNKRVDKGGYLISRHPYIVLGTDAGERMERLISKRPTGAPSELFLQPRPKSTWNDPAQFEPKVLPKAQINAVNCAVQTAE